MKIAALLLTLLTFAASPAFGQDSETPINDAGEWVLINSAVGCWARHAGDDVNVQILRARDGGMIIGAGRPDWNHSGEINLTLSIDEGAQEGLSGTALGNLTLVAIKDEGMRTRLRGATTLSWHLPWGDFKAAIGGFGTAFDALANCDSGIQ